MTTESTITILDFCDDIKNVMHTRLLDFTYPNKFTYQTLNGQDVRISEYAKIVLLSNNCDR